MISPYIKCVAASFLAVVGMSEPGRALAQEGRFKATGTVSVATLRVPVKAGEHLEKARQAAIAGHDRDYERELAAALAIYPAFGEAYVLRASRQVVAGRFEEAIADVHTAQKLEPGIAWATIVHAEACNGLRRFDEAYALLDGLKSTELGTWQAKYEMTRAVVGRRDAIAALQWSKLAQDSVPASAMPNVILLRADAYQLLHRWRESVEQFDKYLALPGTQPMRAQVSAIRERVQKNIEAEKPSIIALQ